MTEHNVTSLHDANFRISRTAQGVTLDFPALRAPEAALGLLAFSALCGLMPALGLGALLPLDGANAADVVSLALIGGFAAPFILASVVFALLALYQLANSLHLEIDANGVRSERRVFGYVIRRGALAHSEIASIEPRISARLQNLFSSTPRYALIAKHVATRNKDLVIGEDLAGTMRMREVRNLASEALGMKIPMD